ncbi:MAG TPA: transcription elongation factor GreA [Candidatus Paceibacterota bacterium]|nr:transcription elongation factor GreA [Candidatus Paceibacterota bacterium]
MHIPRRQWSRRPPPNNEPVYLTPEGIKRLTARLDRLKRSLPAVIEEAARTAAYGDRSDNAEYKEAKGILRRTRGQILNIEDQLKRVVAIPASGDVSGSVGLGSTVKLMPVVKSGAGGKTKIFRILGSSETDPGRGRISHTSPLGAALLGHKKGDVIIVQTPGGKQEYRIVEIK